MYCIACHGHNRDGEPIIEFDLSFKPAKIEIASLSTSVVCGVPRPLLSLALYTNSRGTVTVAAYLHRAIYNHYWHVPLALLPIHFRFLTR